MNASETRHPLIHLGTIRVQWMKANCATYLEKIQTFFVTSRITVSLMAVVVCDLTFVLKLLAWRLYTELRVTKMTLSCAPL